MRSEVDGKIQSIEAKVAEFVGRLEKTMTEKVEKLDYFETKIRRERSDFQLTFAKLEK